MPLSRAQASVTQAPVAQAHDAQAPVTHTAVTVIPQQFTFPLQIRIHHISFELM